MSDHPHQAQREPWRVDEDEPWVIRQGSYYVANFSRPADAAQAVAAVNAGLAGGEPAGETVVVTRRFFVAVREFLQDWQKGDFSLSTLAALDAQSIADAHDAMIGARLAPPAPAAEVEDVAKRIVQRIENANFDFPCDADREEAVEIVAREIAALQAARAGAGAGADDTERAVKYHAEPPAIHKPAPPVPETAVEAARGAYAAHIASVRRGTTSEITRAAMRAAIEAALPHLAQPGDATEEGR